MAKRRRSRGLMGLGVLPVVGVLSAGKLLAIGGGLFAAWKLRQGAAAPAAPAAGADAALPTRADSTMGNKLVRPNTASPAAARDAFATALKQPIGSEQQLQVVGRVADSYVAAAVRAGVMSSSDAQRISAQPLAQRVATVAAQVGTQPTILTAVTSPTLQTVAQSFSAPMATITPTTLLRLR